MMEFRKIENKYIVYFLIALISFSFGAALFYQSPWADGASKTPKETTNNSQLTPPLAGQATPNTSQPLFTGAFGPETIADMVEKAGPAVVNIDVVKLEKRRTFDPFKMFERDFGFGFDLNPDMRDFYEDKIVPVKGAGSGFIIDSNGDIITNEHVVGDADKIKVTLKDGRKFDAKKIGSDKTLDLAIIKVEEKGLPALTLGDSSKIRPGEWVVAIGNPYQFSNTVTAGIISATGRALDDLGKKDLIQTDTPINPGNSGGPLLNLKGEVIGVNVAIAAGAQGIGFAIPINAAKDVLGDLIKKGKVSRAWVGIYMRDVDEQIANYLDLPIAEGVVLTEVAENSPAERAGLKKYDIIRQINETKIKTSKEVQEIIEKLKPGTKINVSVWREGKIKEISVKLGEKP